MKSSRERKKLVLTTVKIGKTGQGGQKGVSGWVGGKKSKARAFETAQ